MPGQRERAGKSLLRMISLKRGMAAVSLKHAPLLSWHMSAVIAHISVMTPHMHGRRLMDGSMIPCLRRQKAIQIIIIPVIRLHIYIVHIS